MPYRTISLLLVFIATLAQGQYFPQSALGATGVGKLKNGWYTAQLRGLQEPSLFALTKNPEAESYRFLWLRSFHHPIAVRLDPKADGTSILTIKIASGSGGFRPGSVSENTSRLLTSEQTQAFLMKVQAVHFWKLPNPVNDQRGTDGSQWVVEGVKHGRYHLVDRWTPEKGPVRELGVMLAFQLAKISVPEDEIY